MPSDVDRLKSGLVSLIQWTLGARIIQRIDYLALYPCRVVKQNSDGSLELYADDERVGTPGSVPIRYGVPGVKATVPPGSRCYLTFGGGDPQKPIVVDWESGTILTLVIGGGSDFLVKGTTFKGFLDTFVQALKTASNIAAVNAAAIAFQSSMSTTTILSTVVTTI